MVGFPAVEWNRSVAAGRGTRKVSAIFPVYGLAVVNKGGNVAAGGQANMNRMARSGSPIIIFQSLSQRMRCDADNRV